ncbi:hypothetical protein CHLNCDRAFT_133341 [Chlorella variabilis]|uniref:Uncharacterized protein n=1 Tax=Chlorella variabilis TaxID=554065 RepID=E1Z2W5_CHLVA|nr:hypothetical protein CHLNCDRAFT_133341 [Chlorella variabilis]EFN59738.1 hypothetical protein CHLNCDRAFT_133341 [Chlorella variabilis]|eukprot:XP_005851840.1 hypothetical protein CHLNCDRAFT_133341 [Chlorella variabilis]
MERFAGGDRINRQVTSGPPADLFVLVLCTAGLHRFGAAILEAPPGWRAALLAWQVLMIAGSAAILTWRLRWRKSYLPHRELSAVFMRLICMGFGLGSRMVQQVLNDTPVPMADRGGPVPQQAAEN